MPKYAASIRNKVRFAFYACIALIIGVSLLNFYNLKTLHEKISLKLVISDFFNTVLEMRRYEKNYILFKDRQDYLENVRYTDYAKELLEQNKEEIRRLLPREDAESLEYFIREYEDRMKKYYVQTQAGKAEGVGLLEVSIRARGKKLASFTEDVFRRERKGVLELIARSKDVLFISMVVLAAAGYLIGHYISTMVVSPLKKLQARMQSIADGRFDTLSIEDSPDKEALALYGAFKSMLAELEHRQKRLMLQSEKLVSLGTMVSGVAHEINNPLSNISSSCQILIEEFEDGDLEYKKELLKQIEGEVDRAKATVRNLLEFSGKREFKIKKVCLKELTENSLKLIKGDLPPGLEFRLDIPADCCITADKQRVQQAMLNIIKNGADSIVDDGAISISARTLDGWVEIRISDTGMGIEPEKLGRIFEPFFTTKAEDKGSGLGLFVTREIIEEHGGTVEVESAIGAGTTFIVALPVKEQNGRLSQDTHC